MLNLTGSETPWLRRLDHLICEVPDIDAAVDLFLGLGFPLAWPVGRFWPEGRTAGVAIGGINLEFLQLDEGSPAEARIRTLVFEPFDLEAASAVFTSLGVDMRLGEKWEGNPALLQLRGFTEDESRSPQLICRNAYPSGDLPIDFFLCEYSPKLKQRLSASAFPPIPPIARVILATPEPWENWRPIDCLLGTPVFKRGLEISISEDPSDQREVVAICSDRGAIDLGDWPARFRFV